MKQMFALGAKKDPHVSLENSRIYPEFLVLKS